MGLRQTLKKAAQAAFNAAGDLAKSGTYISVNDDGLSAQTEQSFAGVRYIAGDFSLQERTKMPDLQPGDAMATIIADELPCEPKEGDRFTDVYGDTYGIKTFSRDGARVLVKLHLRKA